jgi:hypothetical protein
MERKILGKIAFALIILLTFTAYITIPAIEINAETRGNNLNDVVKKAIIALKNKDTERLSLLTHPLKGIRFSPYSTVYIANDIVFKRSQIKKMFVASNKYNWGNYDETGLEILLTPAEYYEQFIYNANFANVKQINYNKVIGKGNYGENQSEVYHNATIVEFYVPRVNPKLKGKDWQSLRIAFEKYHHNWYIVGIIHNNVIGTKPTKPIYKEGLTRAIDFKHTNTPSIDPREAEKIIEKTAAETIFILKNKDFKRLSMFVHPNLGVRFTPYTIVNDEDLIFTSEQIKAINKDNQIYIWGSYEGAGNPIQLTFRNYFDQFVYSGDFLNAKEVGYNRIIKETGFSENQFSAYPNSIIVEYYISSPSGDGFQWQSLRLVFEEYKSKWYLVGIIHNEYTI